MATTKRDYRVVPCDEGWAVVTDGRIAYPPYVTKGTALEAIYGAAELDLLSGAEVNISIPAGPESATERAGAIDQGPGGPPAP